MHTITTQSPMVPHVVGADLSPVVQWATKAGKAQTAYSSTGGQLAPKAARLQAAAADDVARLQHGQYRPFLRDVVAACTTRQLDDLRQQVLQALTVTGPDGVTLAPVGDVLAGSNRKILDAVGQWLMAPCALKPVKGGQPVREQVAKVSGKLSAYRAVYLAFAAPAADAPADAPADAAPGAIADAAPADADAATADADAMA